MQLLTLPLFSCLQVVNSGWEVDTSVFEEGEEVGEWILTLLPRKAKAKEKGEREKRKRNKKKQKEKGKIKKSKKIKKIKKSKKELDERTR